MTNLQNATTYSFSWSAGARNTLRSLRPKAYRYGLNPNYNRELASADPTYAVQQYAWAQLSEVEFNTSDPQQVRSRADSQYMVIAPNLLWPAA